MTLTDVKAIRNIVRKCYFRCHAHTDGIQVNHNYCNIDIKTELLFNIISIHIYPLNNPFHLIRFSKNFVYHRQRYIYVNSISSQSMFCFIFYFICNTNKKCNLIFQTSIVTAFDIWWWPVNYFQHGD
jgi:hypothetical protein